MNVSVIVLDVGASMAAVPSDGSPSKLETAIKAINLFVQDKMFNRPKDEVALVLMSTDETGNRLAADDPGSYMHIEVRRDLQLPDLELVRQVTNSIIPGSVACDILDAVIVAMDVFVTRTADMKKKPEKMELLVFSDLVVGYTDPDAQIHDVVGGLVNEGIVVKSVGHSSDDFGRDEDEDEDEGGGSGAVKKEEETTVSVVGGDPVSAVRLVCQQTGGMMYTMAEAMPVLSQYKIRGVKPSTVFQGPLEIAGLKIPVMAVNRIQAGKTLSFSKVSPYDPPPGEEDTATRAVTVIDTYQTESGEQIEKIDIIKGYRYGKEIVPWDQEDAATTGVETDRCLRLICFVPEDKISRVQFSEGKLVSFQARKDDPAASLAFSSLALAMKELKVYAVCRYCFRNKASPKILALWPHIKPDYNALLGVRIPFKEDYKEYSLPGLTTMPKYQPTGSQQVAMDAFVNVMDLMTAATNEDGDPEEALQPKSTFNPVVQRMYQGIQHRALNPQDPIPELDPLLKDYVEPHKKLWEITSEQGRAVTEGFQLTMVDDPKKRKKKGTWESEDNVPVADSSSKRARADDTVASVLSTSTIIRIGEGSNVIDDYRQLVDDKSTDNLDAATKDLQGWIEKRVDLYLGGTTDMDSAGSTFVDCMTIMRQNCQKADEPGIFNAWCIEYLKPKIDEDISLRAKFKQQLAESNVSLLSRVDCKSSELEPADARLYELGPTVAATVVEPVAMEEEDDDLDDH